jgi:hypothetical protein
MEHVNAFFTPSAFSSQFPCANNNGNTNDNNADVNSENTQSSAENAPQVSLMQDFACDPSQQKT